MSVSPAGTVATEGNKQAVITVQAGHTYTADKVITKFANDRRDNINFAVKALAIEGRASESPLIMYQSAYYGIDTLKNEDLYTAKC